MRAKTLANYEGYLKKHLLPYFGPRDICTITIDDVQEFMNSKAAYSKKTIEELLLTLGMILNAVKEDGLISINPAKSKRLRKQFAKKSGEKFSAYLTRKRIERAKVLLQSGESINRIAEQVGCGNNPQYFGQLFKRIVGMTPSEYAKKAE